MQFKLDENIPIAVKQVFLDAGFECDTVPEENLAGSADPFVWLAAQSEGRVFVTQDLDFSDIRQFLPGSHCGLVLLRLGNSTFIQMRDRLKEVLQSVVVEEWLGSFVVVTMNRVRHRAPQ